MDAWSWRNSPQIILIVMTQIPEALRAKTVSLDLDKDGTIKTLECIWNPCSRCFQLQGKYGKHKFQTGHKEEPVIRNGQDI